MHSLRLPDKQWFLHLLKPLGYLDPNEAVNGHCCGAAYMSIRAMQTDRGVSFNTRLCVIYEILERAIYYALPLEKKRKSDFVFLNRKPDESYENYIARMPIGGKNIDDNLPSANPIKFAKKIKQLIAEWPLPFAKQSRANILSWLESVVGTQNPLILPINYQINKVQNQLAIFDNDELLAIPLETAGYLTGYYNNIGEIDLVLVKFKEELHKNQVTVPVSFFVRNVNHLAAFTYYPLEDSWQYFNSNNPAIVSLTFQEMLFWIEKKLMESANMAAAIQILAKGEINKIQAAITQTKTLSIYDVDDVTRYEFDKIGGSWLYVAIAAGDYETVATLVNKIPLPFIDEFYENAYLGCSPLLMALFFDHQIGENNNQIIELLFEKYPLYRNAPATKDGETPLIKAVERNRLDLVKKLIDSGITITEKVYMLAIQHGYEEILLFFFSKIRINPSALFFPALIHGHLSIVKLLLSMKNDLIKMVNLNNQNALSLAAANGHYDIVRYLHQNLKMDLNHFPIPDKSLLSLDWAIKNGHAHVVHYLLQHKAIAKDMRLAFVQAAKAGYLETVKLLFVHHSPLINAFELNNQSALVEAAREGHYLLVKFLYEKEKIIHTSSLSRSSCCEKIETALEVAIKNREDEIIEFLISQGERSELLYDYFIELININEISSVLLLYPGLTEHEHDLALTYSYCQQKIDISRFLFSRLSFWHNKSDDIQKKIFNVFTNLIEYGGIFVNKRNIVLSRLPFPYPNQLIFSPQKVEKKMILPLLNFILHPNEFSETNLNASNLKNDTTLLNIYKTTQILIKDFFVVKEIHKKMRIGSG